MNKGEIKLSHVIGTRKQGEEYKGQRYYSKWQSLALCTWGATLALTVSELIQKIIIVKINKEPSGSWYAFFKKLNLNANMRLGR